MLYNRSTRPKRAKWPLRRPAVFRDRGSSERKVRAPQDTVVGNAHRPQGPGKCNRKQTARRGTDDSSFVRRRVRVKRCGKSAPAGQATGLARQTPPGARPRRKNDGQPSRAGPARKSFRVGRLRRRATAALEKWSLSTEPGLSARFGLFLSPFVSQRSFPRVRLLASSVSWYQPRSLWPPHPRRPARKRCGCGPFSAFAF
jgi:hypothetical protein